MPTLEDAFTQALARPTIVSDIDNTIAFYREAQLAAINARFGLQLLASQQQLYRIASYLTPDQAAWVDSHLRTTPTFHQNVAPDALGIGALRALKAADYYIVIATARPTTLRSSTQGWLTANNVPCDQLLMGPGDKVEYVQAHPGAVVFDDKPEHAVTIPAAGGVLWMPRRPWTPAWCDSVKDVYVFTSWSQPLGSLGVTI